MTPLTAMYSEQQLSAADYAKAVLNILEDAASERDPATETAQ